MTDYNQGSNESCEDLHHAEPFESMSNEKGELFKHAISEGIDSKIFEIIEKNEDMETPLPSKRHKRRMNRLFYERVGGTFLPFPEVDNLYERVRSKLVIKRRSKVFSHHKSTGKNKS